MPRRLDLSVESLDPAKLAAGDVIFLALPHGHAMALAPQLVKTGKRVIDLSGDFRLKDAALYARWYQFEHAHPEWLNGEATAYGLSEFYADQIRQAKLVANPGCYATSILLAILPLFKARLVEDNRFIADAKSGYSGAGRNTQLETEMQENLRPYKVNAHQHMPEVLQEIARLTGRQAAMAFVPQVIPAARGLISMMYVRVTKPGAVKAAYDAAYTPDVTPFVRVREGALPELREVAGTNYCDIGFVYDQQTGYLTVASALDNLTKGAAGQAIQNFNLMHGFPETTGLL